MFFITFVQIRMKHFILAEMARGRVLSVLAVLRKKLKQKKLIQVAKEVYFFSG